MPGAGLHFTVADPPLAALAGTQYNAIFRAPGAADYELVGAPAWLAVTPTGAVTGTPPAGTGSFTYSLRATTMTGSATVGPFTVAVHAAATVSGTVERPDGTPLADALVQDCASVTGWQCRRTLTSSDGTFSLDAPVAASIVLAAFPPAGSGLFTASRGPLTVPVDGLQAVRIVVGAAQAQELPSGLRINGQSTTPRLLWTRSSSATLTGCEHGLAVVSVIGVNRVDGKPFLNVTPLTETPPGSGAYVGTIPPLAPNNGPVRIESSVMCPPQSPLLPNTGPATGGNTIDITGSGFTGASGVRFGGAAATFTVQADDLIEAVVPPGTGTVPVTVAVGASIHPVDDYTYVAITSISPANGPPGGGTVVEIRGTGLASATRVAFGENAADFVQVTDSEIHAVSPPGSGTRDITVTTAYGGTTPITPAARFTYLMTATLRASDFDGLPRLTIPQDARTAVLVPAVAATFRLVLAYAKDWLLPVIAAGTAAWRAAILAIGPTCEIRRAALKDLFSLGILGGALKLLPGTSARLSDDALEMILGASGPVLVDSTIFVVGSTAVFALNWLIDKAVDAVLATCSGAPGFDSSPVFNGLIDPSGTVVDRNGNLIVGATATILRSDSAAGPFAPVSATSPGISPHINPQTTGSNGMFQWDVAAGFYEVEASKPGCTDPGNAGSPTSTIGPLPVPPPQLGLVITLACPDEPPPPVPSVTSLSVGTGPPAGGTPATILGSGFTPSSTVTFGQTSAPATFLSSEMLMVVSPPGAGLVHVVVHNPGASSSTSTADQFFYGSPPTVGALSVDRGPATGGTSVTVTGTGFTGATHVAFGGLPASSFSVLSDTEIQASAPARPVGVAHLLVLTPAGASAETSADQFTYELASQAIGFASLTDKTYGDPDFTVSATASSGLPVTFGRSGDCTLSLITVHITGAGSCTITASQAGNSTYGPANDLSRTFVIAKAPQTITFGALANKTYGDADFVVSATATSGLAVSFAASGSCTVNAATVHLTGAGSCTVSASQAGDANYNAAPLVSRTFPIARKPGPPATCKVPNVVGKRLGAAKSSLKRARCGTGKVTYAYSRRRKRGFVVSQSRRPGKILPATTKVSLVVSRGRKR